MLFDEFFARNTRQDKKSPPIGRFSQTFVEIVLEHGVHADAVLELVEFTVEFVRLARYIRLALYYSAV